MEIKQIIKIINKYARFVFILSLFGLFIGGILGYITEKHYAVGSFFIGRKVDPNQTRFFTYEGYYGQQTALSYAKTVASLITSPDVKKQTLDKLGISVNDTTLREFGNLINVKKTSPQLITVTVKASTEEKALKMWILLSESLIETTEGLSTKTDPNLVVTRVLPTPIVKYSPLPLITLPVLGGLLFFGLSIFLISLKKYLK